MSDILGILRSFEPRADNPRILVTHALQATRDAAMEEFDTLRADLAKARARCAELAAALTSIRYQLQGTHDAVCVPTWTNYGRHEPNADCCLLEPIDAALASDGTSALAAVRLAQRLVKMVTPPKERPADLGLNRREKLALEVEAALTEAFGSGE